MGTMVIDSVPPATITCADPARIRSAAIAITCNPEEQKRLMVIAEISIGRPARSDAIRATFIPCSPSGIAQPRITSSICRGSSPLARDTASLMATAARSSGRVARSVPFGALPTAVRTELTITASRIRHLNLDLHGNEPNALDAAAMGKATAGVRSGYFGDRIPGRCLRRELQAELDLNQQLNVDGLAVQLGDRKSVV